MYINPARGISSDVCGSSIPLYPLYLLACQVRITVGDSGLCFCVCVTSFGCSLSPFLWILHRRFGPRSVSGYGGGGGGGVERQLKSEQNELGGKVCTLIGTDW